MQNLFFLSLAFLESACLKISQAYSSNVPLPHQTSQLLILLVQELEFNVNFEGIQILDYTETFDLNDHILGHNEGRKVPRGPMI